MLPPCSQSAVSTALPTIINHFQGQQFVWIGSAYTLAGVAFLPLSGHFANLFGRRPILLAGLALFALGSALCGAAPTSSAFIGGRALAGTGVGGAYIGVMIIIAASVPLHRKPFWAGLGLPTFPIE